MRAAFVGLVVLLAACSGGQLTPKERAEEGRRARTKCDAGDVAACTEACGHGGPNALCDRACKADDGRSCALLASRLDHEQDSDDGEALRAIGPQDADEITGLFERGCSLGHGPSCVEAGGRIMNGQGRGKRTPGRAVELLKVGCEKHKEGAACCAMAQLNAKLAQSSGANDITDFKSESMRWQKVAERRGVSCPLDAK